MLASHFLFTGMTPIFGTVPVGLTFLVGGIAGNAVAVLWMGKRGGDSYNEKFPGQFFGGLGMSAANLSMLGFAAAVHPKWIFKLYGVIPLRVSYLVVGAWLFEAFQYWQQTGWDKIQSSVCPLTSY
jgi:hypothetical protein